ncbi:hypothetical protein IFR05_003670 [Cadophora sp. M221]|nr:hypothetical protein IFR05_003670 [Cadophora sp. M221]
MAALLESLSEELLVRIVTFTDRPSLPSLALASRTMNRLTNPELYASIDFKGASGDKGVEFLIPLTYCLLKNPDLATLVRSLSIRRKFGSAEDDFDYDVLIPLVEGGDNEFRKGWPSSADPQDIDALLQRAVGDMEDTEQGKDKLFNTVRNGTDEGSIIAILLSNLPNLRSLDVAAGMTNARFELLRFFQRVAKREAPFDRKPVLTNLSDVLISGWDQEIPSSSDLLGAYLGLPSIRRLHGHEMMTNYGGRVWEIVGALGRGTSPVEELELRASQLGGEDLERVLNSCRNLKTFICEIDHDWSLYPGRVSDIMKSMKAVEKTLENLVLEHGHGLFYDHTGEDGVVAVSLANFKELRYLKILSFFLEGYVQDQKVDLMSIFPASLENLHLTYRRHPNLCVLWLLSALQQAIEHKDAIFSALRKLTVEGPYLGDLNRLEEIKELVLTAKENGVEIVILAGDGLYACHWIETPERGWGIDEEVEWKQCWENSSINTAGLTLDVEWDESGVRKINYT